MAAATDRPTSRDSEAKNGEKSNLWTSMLESVASGKRLPEKNLVVLGGTPETQRDFVESLATAETRRHLDKQKIPPIANSFALGYTYYDVLDADQEDTLARVSLYLLSQPSGEFASLIAPLLTPEMIPNTALVILLDWNQPHLWLRQIWKWIQVMEEVMGQIGSEEKEQMEENIALWKERGRGGGSINLDGTPSATNTSGDGEGSLPLGLGEWEEPLGLPLCVVCQNAQRMEFLEKQNSWKEPDFDNVLQFLRTILLRHGASLVYTSQNAESQLPSLIHSTLGITSLLKRAPLKHNVIDRDKIVVPPNWDSWGKIRVLGGSFDAELISKSWAEDIKMPLGSQPHSVESLERAKVEAQHSLEEEEDEYEEGDTINGYEPQHVQNDSAIARYEDWCREPATGGLPSAVESAMNDAEDDRALGVQSDETQDFLEQQSKILEAFRARAPEVSADSSTNAALKMGKGRDGLSEQIGPVQFNMGGIQVDADDMLQRLKERNQGQAAEDSTPEEDGPATVTKDFDNDQLQSFFSGLMKRKTGADSPR